MATQLQLRRGTEAENDAFTGAQGEVTVDTTNNHLRVHDGTTSGGYKVANIGDEASKDLDNLTTTGKANISTLGTYDENETYASGTVGAELAKIVNKADAATTLAGYGITDGADTDLDNLTATGANIANWSSNVSNCITNIPQDIKLELNNGTLTLKAGSKVYVPNGSGVFDEVVIANDISSNSFAGSIARFVFIDINNNTINAASAVFSGTTAPTLSGTGFWYDTTHNVIKRTTDSGATWTTGYSFPIAIVTSVNDVATSINQTFNGFGYIGSTVFALPGVKGLIPDGRNADGSLKNTTTNDFTTVKTVQVNTSTAKIGMYGSGGLGSQTKNFELNEQENFNYDTGVLTNALEVARVIVDSNAKITAFTPKQVFHAIDYSDSEYIAHCAMPSTTITTITPAPASGGTMIAPADGYFVARAAASASGNYLELMGGGINSLVHSGAGSLDLSIFIPVQKGTSVTTYYSTNTPTFKFVYANGAK